MAAEVSHKVILVCELLASKSLNKKVFGFVSLRSHQKGRRNNTLPVRLRCHLIWHLTEKTSLFSYVTTGSTLHNTHPSPWMLVIPWLLSLRTQGRVAGGLHGPTLIVVVQLKITAPLQGTSASPLPEPSLAFATEVCMKTVGRLRENCKRKNRRHNGLRNGAGHQ